MRNIQIFINTISVKLCNEEYYYENQIFSSKPFDVTHFYELLR
jgi:hypothetical protein